jgi:hypothetical protein
MAIMPRPTPSSCCAGLRPTLTQGWREGLPLTPAPFRQLASRSGSTPLELIRTCAGLLASGALQPIHARWGPGLVTERWRVFFDAADTALLNALAALPGCVRIEQVVPAADARAAHGLWAELEALDANGLSAQLKRLPAAPSAQLCVQPAQPGDTPSEGPRGDPALAAALEAGLALSAHPFAHCARQLGRSERSLLASLQRWQQRQELHGLVLAPPPPRQPRPGWVTHWCEPPVAHEPGWPVSTELVRARTGPATTPWPWALMAVSHGMAPPQGLAPGGCHVRVQISEPRAQAQLFTPPG